ncbi:MAG TPA: hypothetical protein VGX68_03465 [Thermoanaerobaculia bacterium]|jgi:hypothetical protein|nr:hypothetical protein [Thermoanaerobaculia bacterium]
MLEYLKKAFWAGPTVPGLGRLPVNALAAAGFAILGIGHPAFWLLGAGLEAAYLTTLATHPRFQRLVDAQRRSQAASQTEEGRQELIRKLDATARQRLALVEEKRERILQLARESGAGAFELASQRDALDRMTWIYLKLLVGRHHLQASQVHATEADLKRRIAELERDMASAGDSSALRESQAATLKILQQRLGNLGRFEQTLKQVDSDLARIEAQVDLGLENAGMRGSGAAVTANLELAGQILDDELYYFGDSAPAVLALDEAYGGPPARQRERG